MKTKHGMLFCDYINDSFSFLPLMTWDLTPRNNRAETLIIKDKQPIKRECRTLAKPPALNNQSLSIINFL